MIKFQYIYSELGHVQENPTALQKEYPALQNRKFLPFFSIWGNFCLLQSGSGFLFRLRIHWPPLNTNSEHCFPVRLCLMTGCAGCLSLSELARTRRGGARGRRYVWRVWVVQTWSSLSRWLQAQNRISQAWVQQEKRLNCQILYSVRDPDP